MFFSGGLSRSLALLSAAVLVVAIALAGVGLYASAQPQVETGSGSKLSGDEFLVAVPCGDEGEPSCDPCSEPLYERDTECDIPPPALRPDVAKWWWIGAGGLLLLGATVVAGGTSRRRGPPAD
jgi:hypothetical protein